jgi:hypothetical protein
MKGLRTADDFIKLAEETFLTAFNDIRPEEPTHDIFTDASQKSPKCPSENILNPLNRL